MRLCAPEAVRPQLAMEPLMSETAVRANQHMQQHLVGHLGGAFLLVLPLSTVVFRWPVVLALAVVGALTAVAWLTMTPQTAQWYGILITVSSCVVFSIRAWFEPTNVVVHNMLHYGSQRTVVLMAAVFGGRAACLFFAFLSSGIPFAVVVLKRYLAGDLTWATVLTADEVKAAVGEMVFQTIGTSAVLAVHSAYMSALSQSSDVAKQQFFSTISHEMRTPLVGILSVAELLRSRADDAASREPAASSLQLIQESGRSLLATIENMLSLAQLRSGSVDTRVEVVSIHAVVSAIAEGFSDAANKKGLTYTLTVDPSLPPTLLLQADMLPRLMQPLIDNAIRFTPAGGHVAVSVGFAANGVPKPTGILRQQDFEPTGPWRPHTPFMHSALSSTENWRGRLFAAAWAVFRALLPSAFFSRNVFFTRTSSTGPALWVKVSDTGIGIEQHHLSQLGEPFHQADSSATRVHGGTGVGLAIVKETARLVRGALVYYSSAPNSAGAVFAVAIPCEVVMAAAETTPLPPVGSEDNAAPSWQVPPPAVADPQPSSRAEPQTPKAVDRRPSLAASFVATAEAAGASPADPALPRAVPPQLLPARRRVLVVDDNPINVAVIKRQLAQCGVEVAVATNGQECVDYVRGAGLAVEGTPPTIADARRTGTPARYHLRARRSAQPAQTPSSPSPTTAPPPAPVDAIFMDLHMPVMDGLTATRILREMEQQQASERRLPIFAVTADDPSTIGAACRAAGMDGFLRKPILLADLTAALAQLH